MRLELTVSEVRDMTDRIREITLSGAELPGFTPGAHLDFDLGAAGTRSYSLIRWPQEAPGPYRIAVQREAEGAGGSKAMHALAVGDRIGAQGPKNDFELGDHGGSAMLLAGGIGVTPIISMATALAEAGRPFAFHYAARSAAAMAYAAPLAAAFGDRLTLHYDDTAPLDLAALLGGLDPAAHLYVCGPKGMIDAARTAAARPEGQFHAELFTTPLAVAGDTAFEVEVASTGAVFTIPPGQSIIEVLEAEGVDLMYDCQRGDCGICQTDVLEGTPDHRDVVLSAAERAGGQVMQICVSRALTPRLKLDL